MRSEELENTASNLADLTFRLLASCHEKEERLAKNHGLTQAEFRCLRLIQAGENINNREIAERMKLSASRLTRIIDGLVLKGYVMREIEPSDRRNMRVYLSSKGVEFTQRLNGDYLNIHKDILSDIDLVQHKPLINAMTHLLSALERWIAKS
ncbi:MAG: MarR family transcriptional regulator [Bacteroidetes bacterium]|nr:MarR family transcriptional regulator [Bacteroidota bacterium]MBU2583918.1 MarR family transcriptional regulator [Bacteroidota bacterium]